jgi:hypothetical protein
MNWLPPLLTLQGCGGWTGLLEAAHQRYLEDFFYTLPRFIGRAIKLRRTPVTDSKEAAFWHLIQEGESEDDRTPSMERCERIAWVRALIEAAGDATRVRLWSSMRQTGRGPKLHWVIALPDFSYMVVLRDDGETLLLLTAYPVERERRRLKLKREYEEWRALTPKGSQKGS